MKRSKQKTCQLEDAETDRKPTFREEGETKKNTQITDEVSKKLKAAFFKLIDHVKQRRTRRRTRRRSRSEEEKMELIYYNNNNKQILQRIQY